MGCFLLIMVSVIILLQGGGRMCFSPTIIKDRSKGGLSSDE